MRSSRPPVLATWLIARFVPGEHTESLIGDLMEQYNRGRSSAWYWRQAISAVATTFAAEMWRHKWTAIWVVVFSANLSRLYMFAIRPRWVARLDAWYPALISWLIERDHDAVLHLVLRLQLYSLTTRVVWCVWLAAVAWTVSRLRPRQRGMVVTLLLVTQVGQCLPYVGAGVSDWLHDPGNPIRFFGALWYAVFVLAAAPCSILVGAARWSRIAAD